jgi:hypothetical protein
MSVKLDIPRIGKFEFKNFDELKKEINDPDSIIVRKIN